MRRRLEALQNEPEVKFPTCSLPPLNEARSAEQCQNGQFDLVLQNQGLMMQGMDQLVEHVVKLKEQVNDLQNRNADDKQVQAQLLRNQATLSDDLEGQLRGPMAVE
ncbi:uncharacterized protein LOC143208914 [Lasioglossum baleicum]|uniref:uncharacterized protein LOC143208823 n=1 Tax=Lasioglossum baleicum TaxID=434251 RepID=UPI003FCC6711